MHTRFARAVALIGLGVGPLTLIIANIVQWLMQPTGSDTTPVAVAQQFPTTWLLIGMLSVFGPVVWLAGLAPVADLAIGRGGLATRIGALITGLGLAAGIGHLAAFFGVYGTIANAHLSVDMKEAASSAADGEPLGTILLVTFLVCYSLGPIILTVGLRAAHRVPVWVPIAAIVTAGANLFGGPIAGVVQLITLAAAWGAVFVAVARSPLHTTARPAAVVAR
ncbi:hypothetical protein [Microbacterium sp.]|uniref:hypothetical protein n=1 Tax=Microbacterium sp. TaxID=51671 RepID=UPI003C770EE3